MRFLKDLLLRIKRPGVERKINKAVTEMWNRPKPGDQDIHEKFEQMNRARDCFETEALADAYLQASPDSHWGAQMQAADSVVRKRQEGIALELCSFAMRDGQLDDSEGLALSSISETVPRSKQDESISKLDLPDIWDIGTFMKLPNDTVRQLSIENAGGALSREDAETIAESFFADGELSSEEKRWCGKYQFEDLGFSTLQNEAIYFLRGLGSTGEFSHGNSKDGYTLLDAAQSLDRGHVEDGSQSKGPYERALRAGADFARTRGLQDSEEASRLLFESVEEPITSFIQNGEIQ